MRKYYSEPELEVRVYSFIQDAVLTNSTPEVGSGEEVPDLNDDDTFDPFA